MGDNTDFPFRPGNVAPLLPQTAAQMVVIDKIRILPFKFKVYLLNVANVTMNNVEFNVYTYNEEL